MIFFFDTDKYFKSKFGLILLPLIYDYFYDLNNIEKKIVRFLDSDFNLFVFENWFYKKFEDIY